MEDFTRYNLVGSTSARTSSNGAPSLLSDSLMSPATTAHLISENSMSIGASSNVFTPSLNPRLDPSIQTCSLTFQDIGLQQTVPSQGSKMPDLLPRCPKIDREIRGHITFLYQTWKHQLDASHGRDERFVLSAPFEEGFQVLQKFYRGKLPTTFNDIFALMHVIYACARYYHSGDETSFWHGLIIDVLRWGNSIATLKDSILFIHVAFELWAVPEYSTAELGMYSDDFASQSSPSHYQQSTPQAISGCKEMDNQLRDVLREGEGIRVCTKYFDGSPIEVASPVSSTGSLCPICNEPFNAKKDRDQQTSLRRHKATKHAPERKLYPCHVEGCDKTYPRSDNLKRHLRKNHKDDVDLPNACGESLAKKNKTADI